MKTHRTYTSVLRSHRSAAIIVTVAAVLAGVLEAFGLAALLPIFGREHPSSTSLYKGLTVLGVFLLCSILVRAVADVRLAALTVAVEGGLRSRFLESLTAAPWSVLRTVRSGDLITALMSESSQVANGANSYLASLAAFSIAVCLGLTAVLIAPTVSLVAVLFAAGSFVAYRRAGTLSKRNQIALAGAASDANEEAVGLLGNLKLLFSTGDRATWSQRMSAKLAHLMALRRRELVVPTVTRSGVEAGGAVFLVSVMALTIATGGRPSTALVTLALFYRVVPRLQSAQSSFLLARTQTAWWNRWQERERSWFASSDGTRSPGGTKFRGPLTVAQMDGVEIRYPGRASPALRDVTVRLRRGDVLAVVGHTGSGKSTLLDVLTGLIAPDGGTYSINGCPIGEVDLDSWQRHIGLVPQEAPLIHGTLEQNVVWLQADADRDKVYDVLRAAALADFVDELPLGLETVVGPRGASLSGGQRQRLAIARALYRDPALLILDEATAGLDPATEDVVLRNIIRRSTDAAVVMVTHRLDTVALATDVVILEDGRMAAEAANPAALGPALERIRATAPGVRG